MTKFWMVYVDGRGTPETKHETLKSAKVEAERLLRLPDNIHRLVIVLQAVEYCYYEQHPIKWELLSY